MSDWNDLRDRWRDEAGGAAVDFELPAPAAGLWKKVRWRDSLESLVGIALAPVFGWTAWKAAAAEQWATVFFAVFLVGAVLYVPYRLLQARRLVPMPDPRRPVREFLRQELEALEAQAGMLRSVSRWYTGPIAIGAVGIFGSIRGFGWALTGYAAVVLLMAIGIELLNRRAARKQFGAAAAEVREQLRQLEEEQ